MQLTPDPEGAIHCIPADNHGHRHCWLESELLPQAKEFKYFRVLFTSDGKMEHEMYRQIGAASAVMQALGSDRNT